MRQRGVAIPVLPSWARWSIWLVAMGMVLVLSVQPAAGDVAETLGAPYGDKIVHVILYAGLALVTAYAVIDRPANRWSKAALIVVGLASYGVILEGVQQAIPARTMETGDMLANAIGALAAFAWAWIEPRVELRQGS